jgi:hypothetical protein
VLFEFEWSRLRRGPNRLAFLGDPVGPGAAAPDALPEGVEFGDETFWRTLLSVGLALSTLSAVKTQNPKT